MRRIPEAGLPFSLALLWRALRLGLLVTVAVQPLAALADWDEAVLPEGSNAYTLHKREGRLSLFGRSGVGLTDRLELSSYFCLFPLPNLGLKYRFLDAGPMSLALEFDAAVGGVPLFAAGLLPIPGAGAAVAGAGVGLAVGSIQAFELHTTLRPARAVAVTARNANRGQLRRAAAKPGGDGGAVWGHRCKSTPKDTSPCFVPAGSSIIGQT